MEAQTMTVTPGHRPGFAPDDAAPVPHGAPSPRVRGEKGEINDFPAIINLR
jgi:hypothetical protein